jgi:hypothetical protein
MFPMINDVAYARPELGPPSIQLRGNLANVTVAKLVEIKTDFSLKFEKIKDLHNSADDIFLVASDQMISSRLSPGSEYIVAYTKHQVDRRTKTVSIRRGPTKMLGLPGAQPAIFRSTDAMLFMFGISVEDSRQSPDEMMSVVWSQIENPDVQIQNFFITELLTRGALTGQLNKKQFKKLVSIMISPDTDPEIRTFILLNGQIPENILSDRKLKKSLTKILATESVNLDLLGSAPAFFRSCFIKLASDNEAVDIKLLARWLRTNSLGVLQYILDHVHRFYPDEEKAMLSRIVDQTLMIDQNRKAIRDRLQRLQ